MKHGFYHECDEAGVTMFGRFSRGEKAGPQWVSTRGGGWLVTEVDTEDRALGEATFLYPDLVTAITGDFREGRLRSGRQGTLSGESSLLITHEIMRYSLPGVRREFGIPVPEVSVLSGSPEICFDQSTASRISG